MYHKPGICKKQVPGFFSSRAGKRPDCKKVHNLSGQLQSNRTRVVFTDKYVKIC